MCNSCNVFLGFSPAQCSRCHHHPCWQIKECPWRSSLAIPGLDWWLWRTVVKVVMWSGGELTWRSQVGENPIPIPHPTNLALFGHKVTLYRFIQGAHTIAGGSNRSRGLSPPPPSSPHFNHWLLTNDRVISVCIAWSVTRSPVSDGHVVIRTQTQQ